MSPLVSPQNDLLRNNSRNSILMLCHCPDLDSTVYFWLVKANFLCGMTNQKHYPDLGSDTSSVWDFHTHNNNNNNNNSSDVILQGNNYCMVMTLQNGSCFLRLNIVLYFKSLDWFTVKKSFWLLSLNSPRLAQNLLLLGLSDFNFKGEDQRQTTARVVAKFSMLFLVHYTI